MNILVTDKGFGPDTWTDGFEPTDTPKPGTTPKAIDISPDTNPGDLAPVLPGLEMIRVDFPSFADGRGFSIARRLRLLGYRGRLRARNTPWRAGPALTRSRSTPNWRRANHKTNGWPAPSGKRMTTSPDCEGAPLPDRARLKIGRAHNIH